jgi:hypothetical protein
MSSKRKKQLPPAEIADTLPSDTRLWMALKENIYKVRAGTVLVRAVRNESSIWPVRVDETYRFGPPEVMRAAGGEFPFHWIYLAADLLTTVWEARLCINDVSEPGQFFFARDVENALIAHMEFDRDLRLLDLTGDAASILGIYEPLSSPDHEWCQWLGCALDRLISRRPEIDGVRYMSRKHLGHYAYAISSRVMAKLEGARHVSIERFGDTQAFSELQFHSLLSRR